MDDLERSIRKRSAGNPKYPEMLAAEIRRQRLIGELVAERKANALTQAAVAKAMNVSQSVVAEIESARTDVRYSTLDRYVEGVSKHRKRLAIVPAQAAAPASPHEIARDLAARPVDDPPSV